MLLLGVRSYCNVKKSVLSVLKLTLRANLDSDTVVRNNARYTKKLGAAPIDLLQFKWK